MVLYVKKTLLNNYLFCFSTLALVGTRCKSNIGTIKKSTGAVSRQVKQDVAAQTEEDLPLKQDIATQTEEDLSHRVLVNVSGGLFQDNIRSPKPPKPSMIDAATQVILPDEADLATAPSRPSTKVGVERAELLSNRSSHSVLLDPLASIASDMSDVTTAIASKSSMTHAATQTEGRQVKQDVAAQTEENLQTRKGLIDAGRQTQVILPDEADLAAAASRPAAESVCVSMSIISTVTELERCSCQPEQEGEDASRKTENINNKQQPQNKRDSKRSELNKIKSKPKDHSKSSHSRGKMNHG